jgi:hypothetical protein
LATTRRRLRWRRTYTCLTAISESR